jgi:hypothetical protein
MTAHACHAHQFGASYNMWQFYANLTQTTTKHNKIYIIIYCNYFGDVFPQSTVTIGLVPTPSLPSDGSVFVQRFQHPL